VAHSATGVVRAVVRTATGGAFQRWVEQPRSGLRPSLPSLFKDGSLDAEFSDRETASLATLKLPSSIELNARERHGRGAYTPKCSL